MTRSKEAERFTARIRALKERAGISFEQLARETGISSSSLHRYCSGTKIPTGYGVVHTFAKACGASNEELRELHRLWALADAARSPFTEPGGKAAGVTDDEHVTGSPAPAPHRRRPMTVAAVTATVVAAVAAGAVALLGAAGGPETSAAGQARAAGSGVTARVRVFNIDEGCRGRGGRVPGCSIGLAVDPRLNYDAHNVVSRRVWHDDALNADCVLYDGDEVTDEAGATSTRWYRVRLGDVPRGHAWLSGIRTRDDPALPACVL